MSTFGSYFSAGYVPALAATYYSILQTIAQHATSPDERMRVLAAAEHDRIHASGLSDQARERSLQMVAIADALGYQAPPPPPEATGFFPWLNQLAEGTRRSIATRRAPLQPAYATTYAIGVQAGEIVCALNLLACTMRFIIALNTAELSAQWTGLNADLQRAAAKLVDAAGEPGVPDALRELGLPFSHVVNDLTLFPQRYDDRPYLILLGRNIQNEVYNLLDLLESTAEQLSG